MELPELFLQKMQGLLGEEYQDYLDSFGQERVYGLRVNTGKISCEEFEKICPFPIRPVSWIQNGYYYEGSAKPAKHPYYFAGLYYLQEPSAMTPADRLPVNPGDRVLDLCAAPGGKSTELGVKLGGKGVLVSNDISNSRAKALLKNLELFGISNMYILSEAPHRLAPHFRDYFDKILIDAPCSGEGMFRKEPAVIKSWLEKGNDFYAKLQREILDSAVQMLRPGGLLLYSTCTFSPMEDEGSVDYVLKKYPELKVREVEPYEGFCPGMPEQVEGGDDLLSRCVRIFPHRMRGEGHFLALLEKEGEKERPLTSSAAGMGGLKELPEEFRDFTKLLAWKPAPERLMLRGEKLYLLPAEGADLSGLRVMRSGLLLGECKKKRFEPSQALAMHLDSDSYENCISFSAEDSRVIKYLKGETIEADKAASGWVLVCVDGFPLGFAKASGTVLKNKYLAGWRWQ